MARKLPPDLSSVWSSIPLSQNDVTSLERAARHEFSQPVTAYLTSVYFVDKISLGIVWGHDRDDESGRFANGHRIHTSHVLGIERDGEFPVILTLNSRYVLISLHPQYVSPVSSVH